MLNHLFLYLFEALYANLELLFRLFLAGVCGIAVGYERMNHHKSAGVKTHMLVGLSAALIMIISKYGFADIPGSDGSRIASQIVSGIGFLGAGMILQRDQAVQGLTTAAGIWGVAGIGMAIGSGMYVIGICSTCLLIFMRDFTRCNKRFRTCPIRTYRLIYSREADYKDILKLQREGKVVSFSIAHLDNGGTRLDLTMTFSNSENQLRWLQAALSNPTLVQIAQC